MGGLSRDGACVRTRQRSIKRELKKNGRLASPHEGVVARCLCFIDSACEMGGARLAGGWWWGLGGNVLAECSGRLCSIPNGSKKSKACPASTGGWVGCYRRDPIEKSFGSFGVSELEFAFCAGEVWRKFFWHGWAQPVATLLDRFRKTEKPHPWPPATLFVIG